MDPKIAAALQDLSDLPQDIFARVADTLISRFTQPSIAQTLRSIAPMPPPAPVAHKRPRRGRPPGAAKASGGVSRSEMIRDILLKEGPKTAGELVARGVIPQEQVHPTLASIGAKPVGTMPDAEGHQRKTYGFTASLIRDEAQAQ